MNKNDNISFLFRMGNFELFENHDEQSILVEHDNGMHYFISRSVFYINGIEEIITKLKEWYGLDMGECNDLLNLENENKKLKESLKGLVEVADHIGSTVYDWERILPEQIDIARNLIYDEKKEKEGFDG